MKSTQIVACILVMVSLSCTREDYLQSLNHQTNPISTPVLAPAKSVKRPLSDFLSTQGTTSDFLPPVPNYFGWGTLLDDGTVRLLAIDYMGFSNQTIISLGGSDIGTQIGGSVTEVPLADGRAKVSVNLHAEDAMFWITDVDLNVLDFSTAPLIMGARPADILDGAAPDIGSGSFQFDFINTAPGAPLPDLISVLFEGLEVEGFELLQIKITANGDGVLHEIPLHELPWEEGDRGKVNVSFHEIYFNNPSPKSKLTQNGVVGSDLRVKKVGN